jgi:hypothetical protein
MLSAFRRFGLPTAFLLGGALPVGFVASFLMSEVLPSHSSLASGASVVAGLIALLVFGGLWGRSLARATQATRPTRFMLITAAAFLAVTLAAVFVLGQLEHLLVEERALGRQPVHVIYAVLFTCAAFLITALMIVVVVSLLHGPRLAWRVALWSALPAAAAFLLADVVQDLLGRRVGGPHAAETITMISVTIIGNFFAALVGGTVMGWRLARVAAPTPASPASHPIGSSLQSP